MVCKYSLPFSRRRLRALAQGSLCCAFLVWGGPTHSSLAWGGPTHLFWLLLPLLLVSNVRNHCQDQCQRVKLSGFLRVSWFQVSWTRLYSELTPVQSLSRVQLFVTPWTAARQASLSFTIPRSLLKLMPTESEMSSNHFILCCALFLLPSVFPSTRVFSNDSAFRIRWPKYGLDIGTMLIAEL